MLDEGLTKEDVEKRLSKDSSVQEVVATYLGVYNITYTNPDEVLAKLEEVVLSEDFKGHTERFEHFYKHFEPLAPKEEGHSYNNLMIEDMFLSGYAGMARIFVNDVAYLWLVFLLDRSGDKFDKPPELKIIGAAISCYDNGQAEPELVHLDGESDPRFMRTDTPTFWFQTNFGTQHKVEFSETMYDGIFNSMHVQVKVDGQEAGYYFSY